jgi:leishmanolysin
LQPKFRLGIALIGAALAACVDSQAPRESRSPTSKSGSAQPIPTVSYLSAAKKPPPDNDPAHFNITLRFVNEPTASQRSAFLQASARWSSVIIGDVPATEGKIPKKACGFKFGAPKFQGTIDDVLIDVILAPIDGTDNENNILGSAGPCLVRSDLLTVYGIMFLDVEDLDLIEKDPDLRDLLSLILVHEMGHVLGFGTLWDFETRHLLKVDTEPPNNAWFTGSLAKAEYGALIGAGPADVPVETDGGPGTASGHWDEQTFGNELMTGFIDAGENPLSRVSVGSMGDLGYSVDLAAADLYELPALTALRSLVQKLHLREELIKPVGILQ